jgi:hypothetical protein
MTVFDVLAVNFTILIICELGLLYKKKRPPYGAVFLFDLFEELSSRGK